MLTHYEMVYQNGKVVIEAHLACGATYSAKGNAHTHDLRKVSCLECIDRCIAVLQAVKSQVQS